MERENSGYVYAYGWNRRNMGVVGVWPEDNQNVIVKNRAWIYAVIILFFIWLPMIASFIVVDNDIGELVEGLTISGPVGISIYKLWIFRKKRGVLSKFLCDMARDWAKPRSNDEMEQMMQRAKWGRFISITSVLITTTTCIMFMTLASIGAYSERQNKKNDSVLAVGSLCPAYFPFDTISLVGYLPIMIGQYCGTIVSIVGNSGPDSLMSMMILHLVGQLATVRIALISIVDEKSIEDRSIYWKRLSTIVQRHEELNRCSKILEDSFNLMLLMQMIMCTITFCFQGYVLSTTFFSGLTGDDGFPFLQMIYFTSFALFAMIHLFVYCWAVDLLVVESTSLSYAPYESEWYLLKPHEARALMMFTYRARVPLQLTAGRFVGFSLELFTTVIKTSMGYLSVLLAVEEP